MGFARADHYQIFHQKRKGYLLFPLYKASCEVLIVLLPDHQNLGADRKESPEHRSMRYSTVLR